MYPAVVMVLVENQRSMTDISLPNARRLSGPVATKTRAPNLGHPSFSVLNIMRDNEAGFSPPRAAEPGCAACAGTWFGVSHSLKDKRGSGY